MKLHALFEIMLIFAIVALVSSLPVDEKSRALKKAGAVKQQTAAAAVPVAAAAAAAADVVAPVAAVVVTARPTTTDELSVDDFLGLVVGEDDDAEDDDAADDDDDDILGLGADDDDDDAADDADTDAFTLLGDDLFDGLFDDPPSTKKPKVKVPVVASVIAAAADPIPAALVVPAVVPAKQVQPTTTRVRRRPSNPTNPSTVALNVETSTAAPVASSDEVKQTAVKANDALKAKQNAKKVAKPLIPVEVVVADDADDKKVIEPLVESVSAVVAPAADEEDVKQQLKPLDVAAAPAKIIETIAADESAAEKIVDVVVAPTIAADA